MSFKLTELQEEWLQALESGEYKQAVGGLFTRFKGYCCLGVACRVVGVPAQCMVDDVHLAPDSVIDALNLEITTLFGHGGRGIGGLVDLNDVKEYTFAQIAAEIRANPTHYFTKGAE